MRMVVKFNNLPTIPKTAQTLIEVVVKKTAFDIQRTAVSMAPVDTGALRTSIYVAAKGVYLYRDSKAASRILRPDTKFARAEKVTDPMMAKVVVPIHYAIYHEFGWARRPAKPFLKPAAVSHRNSWETAITQVLQALGTP